MLRVWGFTSGVVTGASAVLGYAFYGARSQEFDEASLPVSTLANMTDRTKTILKFGLPQTEALRCKTGYVSMTRHQWRAPVWVMEHLNKDLLQDNVTRSGIQFTNDADLPEMFQARNADYFRSGLSRGHMAPAGNHRISREALEDTFLLNSNIVPQDYDNNVFYWNRIERFVRNLVHSFDDVWIVTGPLFLPPGHMDLPSAENAVDQIADGGSESSDQAQTVAKSKPRHPRTLVTYGTIGHREVAVPTHLFKAVIAERQSPSGSGRKEQSFVAFVVPNTPIPDATPIDHFKVDLDTLETWSGIHLFPKVSRIELQSLCECTECVLMDASEHRVFQLTRSLKSAHSRFYTEKAMRQLRDVGLPVDPATEEAYRKKMMEFEASQAPRAE